MNVIYVVGVIPVYVVIKVNMLMRLTTNIFQNEPSGLSSHTKEKKREREKTTTYPVVGVRSIR